MNKYSWIVFKKEILNIIRDKKTLIFNIIIPTLLIPVLMLVMMKGMQSVETRQKTNITVAITNQSYSEDVEDFVLENIVSTDEAFKLIKVDDYEKAIEEETVRVVMDFDKDFLKDIDSGKMGKVDIYYNGAKQKSSTAKNLVKEALEAYGEKKVEQRISDLGLDKDILTPVSIDYNNLAEDSELGALILSMILPMFFVLWPIIGAVNAGPDLGAGEKERGTLEPLLTTKPSRTNLIMGKYFAIMVSSVFSVVFSFVGMGLVLLFIPEVTAMISEMDFSISPFSIIIVVFMSILLSGVFSALILALSVYARSFKEAQTYVSPLTIVVILPVYFMMMFEVSDLQTWHFIVPVMNSIAIYKEAFANQFNAMHLVLAFVSSIVYVGLSLAFCVGMFREEAVLFRD